MSKRAPYLEIVVTVVVMAFLGLVIVGGFDQRAGAPDRVTVRSD